MDKIAAIDLGGTNIKSALISRSGEILKKASTPTEANTSRERVIQNIITALEKIYDPDIIGIGVGSPGCINPETGTVRAIENIPCLNGVSITAELQKKYSERVYIDNDATNAAKGHFVFGVGRGARHLLAITLGTGVGGGLILNGHTHRGVINYAGEIGHITYIPSGVFCSCGKRGCLEAYASATAVINTARSIQKRNIASRLNDVAPEELNPRVICDLAREGDRVAAQIVQEAGKALGVIIGGAMNLLGLDRVIIGGGVSAAGDVLFEPIRLYASRHALPLAFEKCEILSGERINEAGVLGAAAMVIMEHVD